MEFTLTIADRRPRRPDREAASCRATCTARCRAPALSREPLQVHDGTFNLFVDNPAGVDVKNMVYRMTLVVGGGQDRTSSTVSRKSPTRPILAAWPQTTTLYVTVYDGGDDSGPVAAQGILHIQPLDFLRQMTTMRATGGASAKRAPRGDGALRRLLRRRRCGTPTAASSSARPTSIRTLRRARNGRCAPARRSSTPSPPPTASTCCSPATGAARRGRCCWSTAPACRAASSRPTPSRRQPGRVPLRPRLRRLAVRLPRLDRPRRLASAVERRPGGDDRPPGGGRQGARADRRRLDPGGRPLLRRQHLLHGAAGRSRGRALGGLLAGGDATSSAPVENKDQDGPPPARPARQARRRVVDRLRRRRLGLEGEAVRRRPAPGSRCRRPTSSCHDPVCHRITFMYSLLYEHEQLDERIHVEPARAVRGRQHRHLRAPGGDGAPGASWCRPTARTSTCRISTG